MKRKKYKSAYERHIDRLIGFIAFPAINTVVFVAVLLLADWAKPFIQLGVSEQIRLGTRQMLPWIVNGIALVLGFVFRPEFAVGYLLSAALLIFGATASMVLFVGGCLLLSLGYGTLHDFSVFPYFLLLGTGLYVVVAAMIASLFLLLWWFGRKKKRKASSKRERLE